MRRLVLISACTFAVASGAIAQMYKLDDKGKCRDDHGKFAKAALCRPHTYKFDGKKKCRDEKGHFAKAELCHP